MMRIQICTCGWSAAYDHPTVEEATWSDHLLDMDDYGPAETRVHRIRAIIETPNNTERTNTMTTTTTGGPA